MNARRRMLEMFFGIIAGWPDPMTVSASNVIGTNSGFSPCGSVSSAGDSPGTTVLNGTAPFTYLWEQIGSPADGGPHNISSSSAQNPSWSDTRCDSHTVNGESWRVTVTDSSVPAQQAQDTITVTLRWTDLN